MKPALMLCGWLLCRLPLVAGTATSEKAESPMLFFRSDHGLTEGRPTALPDRLDSPAAQLWMTPLDPGHSSPLVVGNRIFVTTYRLETKKLALIALDAGTGKTLWQRDFQVDRLEQTHPIGSPATATPASDGHRVFAFFGSLGLMCFDLDGNRVWEQKMGPFQDEYGAGSSPILSDGLLLLNQDHDVDSFIAAYDLKTGEQRWRTSRPDAVRSYSTPVVWSHEGRREVLVAGALELDAYDIANGKRLWWVGGLARIVIPTPMVVGERIYMACWAPGGDSNRRLTLPDWSTALAKWDTNHDGKLSRTEVDDHEVLDRFFRIDVNQDGLLDQTEWDRHANVFKRAQNVLLALEPKGVGDLSESAVVWKHTRGVPYVSTPVVTSTGLWMVKDGGIVTHLDGNTGRLLSEERATGGGNYFASPVAGDGKVYFASEQGMVTIVRDIPTWEIQSSHDFHEKIYATPTLKEGRLYLRTERGLYCIQRPLAN